MFLEQQIRIFKLFLMDRVTLKTGVMSSQRQLQKKKNLIVKIFQNMTVFIVFLNK